MRQLIDGNIATASVKRTAPMIADNAPKSEPRAAQQADAKAAQGFALASNSSAPVRLDPPATAAIAVPRAPSGSAEPIRPVRVKTVVVRPGNVQTASIAPVQMPAVAAAEPPAETPPATVQAEPPAKRPVARAGMLGVLTVRSAPAVAPVVTASASAATAPAAPPKVRTGWMIQVGAFTNPDEAKQQLTTAKSKAAKLLAAADPFTEPTTKAGTVYHRARFAGLKQDQAEAACKLLKRNDVECITVKN
jgi:D-alanyl-D-alanine carboxypeptidase